MQRRKDGRLANQLRPMSAEMGLLKEADGSARMNVGDTRVLAGVFGPRPLRNPRLEDTDRAILEITLLPSSSIQTNAYLNQIEQAIRQVFEYHLLLSSYPRTVISLTVHIQGDYGSLLSVILNTCTLAFIDSGIPILSIPTAVNLGIVRTTNNNNNGSNNPDTDNSHGMEDTATDNRTDIYFDLLDNEENNFHTIIPTNVRKNNLTLVTSSSSLPSSATANGENDNETTVSSFNETITFTQSSSFPSSVVADVQATLVYSSATIMNSVNEIPVWSEIHGSLRINKRTHTNDLSILHEYGQRMAITILSFLRITVKQKVLRDSVNFEANLKYTTRDALIQSTFPPTNDNDDMNNEEETNSPNVTAHIHNLLANAITSSSGSSKKH